MSSVQDHIPVTKELSERQGSPPSQSEQPQPTQSTQPQRPRTSDSLSSDPREYSPPRFSQLLDALPEGSESHPPRRGISNGTSVTLVNHPSTTGSPNPDTGVQRPPVTHERSQTLPILTSDRRQPVDPIRGDITPTHIQLSDDGDHGRMSSMRGVSLSRPRAAFDPAQGGNGNSPRAAPRATSFGDFYSHPQSSREPLPKTVSDRIGPTLLAAKKAREKYKKNARIQGMLLNGAIGLQVIVGAVTTGVAAGSKNIGAAVAVLGGISTGLASYLAKARGSGEPENSNLRARELDTFIREVRALILDHGHKVGHEFDWLIGRYRERFELILKTEGESSTSGTSHSRDQHPPSGQQQMSPMYSGGPYQHGPGPQGYGGNPGSYYGGNGQLSEKQLMIRNEKAMSAAV